MASRARHVLLLSATPDSGNPGDRPALLSIGELAGGRDDILVFRRTRAQLGWPTARRVRLHRVALSDGEQRLLDGLRAFEREALRAAGALHRDATLLLLSIFRKRALSTTRALGLSLDRRLAALRASRETP